jgi:hypothetical protein
MEFIVMIDMLILSGFFHTQDMKTFVHKSKSFGLVLNSEVKEVNDVSIVRILIIEDDGTTSKLGNGNLLIGGSIDGSLCDGL